MAAVISQFIHAHQQSPALERAVHIEKQLKQAFPRLYRRGLPERWPDGAFKSLVCQLDLPARRFVIVCNRQNKFSQRHDMVHTIHLDHSRTGQKLCTVQVNSDGFLPALAVASLKAHCDG